MAAAFTYPDNQPAMPDSLVEPALKRKQLPRQEVQSKYLCAACRLRIISSPTLILWST